MDFRRLQAAGFPPWGPRERPGRPATRTPGHQDLRVPSLGLELDNAVDEPHDLAEVMTTVRVVQALVVLGDVLNHYRQ